MKILASSPYATFNAKEWNSLSKSPVSSKKLLKLNGKSFKNFKKKYSKESSQDNMQSAKLIQLSFA